MFVETQLFPTEMSQSGISQVISLFYNAVKIDDYKLILIVQGQRKRILEEHENSLRVSKVKPCVTFG